MVRFLETGFLAGFNRGFLNNKFYSFKFSLILMILMGFF